MGALLKLSNGATGFLAHPKESPATERQAKKTTFRVRSFMVGG
jgi:hypothetical protein